VRFGYIFNHFPLGRARMNLSASIYWALQGMCGVGTLENFRPERPPGRGSEGALSYPQ
jgi:hypothetical protein